RLTFVLERQGPVGVRPAVRSLIPAPEIQAPRDSADGLDVDGALRVHSHAGLDGLACPGGQTQTLIGCVIRGSRTDERRYRLTIGAVVLTGGIGGDYRHSHIDSNLGIGDS